MKKRIITSVMITVVFALIIVTSAFIGLVNVNAMNDAKEALGLYNTYFAKEQSYGDINLSDYKYKGNIVRFTVVDKEGTVIFDSESNTSENHKDREEISDAFKNGSGTSIRFSNTLSVNMVYCATKVTDDIVIRSSVPVSTINIFTSGVFKYYMAIVIVVLILSVALAIKLVKIIIYPINELKKVTSKIAAGDLNKRAKVYNYDEIGFLGQTFNEMADQLQLKINDSLDKQSELEAILQSMESGVIALDNQEDIIHVNPYAKKVFDLKEEIIGKNISECIIDYDLITYIREGSDLDFKEIKLFHPTEREIRVRKSHIISDDNKSMGTVVIVQDITDIKRLENMRSEFVANVSHELKTPLTSIKGFAETLRYVDDEETRNKFLDIIDKESGRLTNLINDILVLSNIENMHKIDKSLFNPKEVIDAVLDILKEEYLNKNISVEFKDNFDCELLGNRDKFYQLCLNLIENAIKYSNEGGNVKISIGKSKEYFILNVTDTGIGIPQNDISRIFERFYRVDKSRATRGTGLGLAIVKHIVKLFDGDITVKSKLGEGSTFTVKIKCTI